MALSRLASRLPSGKKWVWVSRVLFDGGNNVLFATVGVPRREFEDFGGGVCELVADPGSGRLWLSAPPQEIATWPERTFGQACVVPDGDEPPKGWVLFEGPVFRTVEELEAFADGPPP